MSDEKVSLTRKNASFVLAALDRAKNAASHACDDECLRCCLSAARSMLQSALEQEATAATAPPAAELPKPVTNGAGESAKSNAKRMYVNLDGGLTKWLNRHLGFVPEITDRVPD